MLASLEFAPYLDRCDARTSWLQLFEGLCWLVKFEKHLAIGIRRDLLN
jgi:hypothetical protein